MPTIFSYIYLGLFGLCALMDTSLCTADIAWTNPQQIFHPTSNEKLLPLLALGYVVLERIRTARWPSLSSFMISGGAAAAVVGGFVFIGIETTSLPITENNGIVTVGKGGPKTLIFVDRRILGRLYGHTFRKFLGKDSNLLSNDTFILTESSNDLPFSKVDRLVISGKFAQEGNVISDLGQHSQIILINPTCAPEEAKLTSSLTEKTLVYFGEYAQTASRSIWSDYPGLRALQIDGASDFVPSWPLAVFPPNKT